MALPRLRLDRPRTSVVIESNRHLHFQQLSHTFVSILTFGVHPRNIDFTCSQHSQLHR